MTTIVFDRFFHVASARNVTVHNDDATALVCEPGGNGAAEASGTTGVVSEDQVKLALRRVKDPDLQLNIMDLGLVYNIAVDGTTVKIDMTLTSPACPSGPELMTNAESAASIIPRTDSDEVISASMPRA